MAELYTFGIATGIIITFWFLCWILSIILGKLFGGKNC